MPYVNLSIIGYLVPVNKENNFEEEIPEIMGGYDETKGGTVYRDVLRWMKKEVIISCSVMSDFLLVYLLR